MSIREVERTLPMVVCIRRGCFDLPDAYRPSTQTRRVSESAGTQSAGRGRS